MSKKKELGQFNTTQKDYILQGFEEYITGKEWVDPFAGDLDLLLWAEEQGAMSIQGYDLDPTKTGPRCIAPVDTLDNPPDYKGRWIIANPPYLAANKTHNEKHHELFDLMGLDDLYKIAIQTICDGEAAGGILIVPLNFLSSEFSKKIRDSFFRRYKIVKCKVFEETVFDDTDYTVCAFYFVRREAEVDSDTLLVEFWKNRKFDGEKQFEISARFDWILGDGFYAWLGEATTKDVGRWTVDNIVIKKNKDNRFRRRHVGHLWERVRGGVIYKNDFDNPVHVKEFGHQYFVRSALFEQIILIHAIDTGTKDGHLGLRDIRKVAPPQSRADKKRGRNPVLAGIATSRNKAQVRFANPPSLHDQERIIEYVNNKISEFREQYRSVFLTAFRNSTAEYSRKRIGFEIVYRMINKARVELGIK